MVKRKKSFSLHIEKPTFIVNRERAIKNIARMADKAQKSGVLFRPHFKTHKSTRIGEWFRNHGVECITVSSVDMAIYFSKNGWRDITVAFPVNILEIEKINKIAQKITLNLLVESKETVLFLKENLKSRANVWIKIDVGYQRAGISWDNFNAFVPISRELSKAAHLSFQGILTYSGHSYNAKSKKEIIEIYIDTLFKMKEVQKRLKQENIQEVKLSVGDTPVCSIIDDFSDVDEIRPGNFVFYDIMQLDIGSCTEEDIAVSVACPVVAKHEERNEIVVYGGAVHLSKDSIVQKDGARIFGYIAFPDKNCWGPLIKNSYVSYLSQEHGIVKTDRKTFDRIKVGDILMVLPVHSCLTADLMKRYITLDGEIIEAAA